MTGVPAVHGAASATSAALEAGARQALRVAAASCTCSDGWHVVWAALKLIGQMRGVHAQAPAVAELLAGAVPPAPRIFIAGAADTGSIEVLEQALRNTQPRLVVADRCPAPLALVQQHARSSGLELHTRQQALHEVRAESAWDLVFIHNTLSFLSREERMAFLRHLAVDLAPGGLVLCGVRERAVDGDPAAAPPMPAAAAAEDWVSRIEPTLMLSLADSCADFHAVQRHLPAYACSRLSREATMPTFAQIVREFEQAGFVTGRAWRNPGLAVAHRDALSAAGSITTWLAVFVHPGV